jgi:hypothetical protein
LNRVLPSSEAEGTHGAGICQPGFISPSHQVLGLPPAGVTPGHPPAACSMRSSAGAPPFQSAQFIDRHGAGSDQ